MNVATVTPRKIFAVVIHDHEYDVYDIEGKEHGGWNGEPKTWWVYYAKRLPDGTLPDPTSENFVPMQSSIERHCWDIKFTQKNTSKEKWGDTSFRNSTWCEMWCNGKLVYAFGTMGGTRGMSFAMAKVQYMQVVLGEHPYNFFQPEQENGRKICWYGLPATVRVKDRTWEIIIVPDYDGMTREEWWNELERRESKFSKEDDDDREMREEEWNENLRVESINWGDAFEDAHIDWFRK